MIAKSIYKSPIRNVKCLVYGCQYPHVARSRSTNLRTCCSCRQLSPYGHISTDALCDVTRGRSCIDQSSTFCKESNFKYAQSEAFTKPGLPFRNKPLSGCYLLFRLILQRMRYLMIFTERTNVEEIPIDLQGHAGGGDYLGPGGS